MSNIIDQLHVGSTISVLKSITSSILNTIKYICTFLDYSKSKVKSSDFLVVVVIASFVTLVRLFVIHHYVDWRFLWGGDQVPTLNPDQLLKSIFSLEQPWRDLGILFIPQLTLITVSYAFTRLISGLLAIDPLSSNLPGWIVNSLWFFLGTVMLWYVTTSFNHLNRIHKVLSFSVLAIFFAFNPWATIDTFKSYLGSTSIRAFLSFIIIIFYVRLVRCLFDKVQIRNYEILFIVASTIILYGISPSSSIRGTVLLFQLEIIFILLVLFAYFLNRGKNFVLRKSLRTTITLSIIPLIVSASILSFYILAGYFAPLKERVISRWGSLSPPTNVLYPPHATTTYSFIGMTSWIAHSGYMPYHELYEKGTIAALMFLWPLIAFGGTMLILARRSHTDETSRSLKLQVILMLILSIISIPWGTALHPPLCFMKSLMVSTLPLIVKVWPWSSGLIFLKFSYMVLSSYVISYMISKALSGSFKFMLKCSRKNVSSTIILALTSMLLISLLLYTSLPIFAGKVFGQYYDENIKGFDLPEDYKVVYGLGSTYYEHALLLPATPTYTSTQWGWQGSVTWYHRLNDALLVRSLAPYSEYTGWSSIYNKLARPCIRVVDGLPITQYVDVKRIKAWNGQVLSSKVLDNGSLALNLILFKGKHTDVILPLKEGPLNISMYNALEIDLKIEGNYTATISPWLFIYSGKYGGAHILSRVDVPGETMKTYSIGVPDKPWPSSKYNPNRVTGFILRLMVLSPANFTSLNVKVNLKIIAGNQTTLCRSYLDLLSLFNIKYIVVDRSLSTYNQFYRLVEDSFRREFKVFYEGQFLSIYETNISTAPIRIVEPENARLEVLEEEPYRMEAKLLVSSDIEKVVVVVPMLYSEALPNPLKITIYTTTGEQLKATPIDYDGLRGYAIDPDKHRELIVDLTYPTNYIAVYLAFLVLNLAPLPMLIVSALLYLRRMMVKVERHE